MAVIRDRIRHRGKHGKNDVFRLLNNDTTHDNVNFRRVTPSKWGWRTKNSSFVFDSKNTRRFARIWQTAAADGAESWQYLSASKGLKDASSFFGERARVFVIIVSCIRDVFTSSPPSHDVASWRSVRSSPARQGDAERAPPHNRRQVRRPARRRRRRHKRVGRTHVHDPARLSRHVDVPSFPGRSVALPTAFHHRARPPFDFPLSFVRVRVRAYNMYDGVCVRATAGRGASSEQRLDVCPFGRPSAAPDRPSDGFVVAVATI